MIHEALNGINKGSITVGATSIGIPATAFDNVFGNKAELHLTIETDQIRVSFTGADATSSDHLYSVGDIITLAGPVNIRNFRMIRVTADATVRWTMFSRPL